MLLALPIFVARPHLYPKKRWRFPSTAMTTTVKIPKGASDNSGSEDAVDDERHLFQEKSNVVEFDSTIKTHWNDALYLDQDAASSSPASRSSSGSGQVERAQSFALGKKIPAYRLRLTS